jgi:DedD protein
MMERRVKERLIGATLLVAMIVLIVPEMLSGPKRPSAPPLTEGLPTAPTRSVSVDLSTSKATAEPDNMADSASAAAAVAAPPVSAAASSAASAAGTADAPSAAGGAPDSDSGNGSVDSPPGPVSAPAPPNVTTLRAQQPSGSPLETPASGPKSGVGGSRPDTPNESASGPQGRRGWSVQLGSFASRANAEKLIHQVQAHGGAPLYVSSSGAGSSQRYRVRVGPFADRGAAERSAGKLRAAGHPATLVAPSS